MHSQLFLGGLPLRIVDAADFDGSAAFMKRGADLSGNADSKKGIFSAWLRLDGGDGAQIRLLNSAIDFRMSVLRDNTNKWNVVAADTVGSQNLLLSSVLTYVAGASWRHLLASWDLATAGARSLYVNDVSDLSVITFVNSNIDYTQTDYSVGATVSGTQFFNGCIAELYFAPGQYLDFSFVANRRKFISEGGKPVHLGNTGALPTGTAPIVYLHLDDAEAVANFATNRGTGGNFTITGSLTAASTSPSD